MITGAGTGAGAAAAQHGMGLANHAHFTNLLNQTRRSTALHRIRQRRDQDRRYWIITMKIKLGIPTVKLQFTTCTTVSYSFFSPRYFLLRLVKNEGPLYIGYLSLMTPKLAPTE